MARVRDVGRWASTPLANTGSPPRDCVIAGELGLKWVFPTVAAGAIVYPFPGGIEIPAGTGLALCQIDATVCNLFDHTPSWLEDW